MDMIKQVISHLRRFEGMYISRKLERYLTEELEEDLFPYGFGEGDMCSIYREVKDAIASANCGDINIKASAEERLTERYGRLRQEHLNLLAEINRNTLRDRNEDNSSEYF